MTRLSNILSDLYEADYDLDNKDKNENEVDNKTDNWMLYEMLLHHKNMLHQQVDHLIKEKCKRERNR